MLGLLLMTSKEAPLHIVDDVSHDVWLVNTSDKRSLNKYSIDKVFHLHVFFHGLSCYLKI